MENTAEKRSRLGFVVVLGSTGQVGQALIKRLSRHLNTDGFALEGARVIGLSRQEVDFTNLDKLQKILVQLKPNWIINAAAYTAVDLAESEPEKAAAMNADLPGFLAHHCSKSHIPLIHYSTDYVYAGQGAHHQHEDAPIAPVNQYGLSKREGETRIAESGCRHLIFRTSWVYSEGGHNFLKTMLSLTTHKETLTIVSDQVGAPTYARQLADWTLLAMVKAQGLAAFPTGIYNLCPAGETNWAEFAEMIFTLAKEAGLVRKTPHIQTTSSAEYGAKAHRPLNSRLDCQKFEATFGVQLPMWTEGVRECIESINQKEIADRQEGTANEN